MTLHWRLRDYVIWVILEVNSLPERNSRSSFIFRFLCFIFYSVTEVMTKDKTAWRKKQLYSHCVRHCSDREDTVWHTINRHVPTLYYALYHGFLHLFFVLIRNVMKLPTRLYTWSNDGVNCVDCCVSHCILLSNLFNYYLYLALHCTVICIVYSAFCHLLFL